MKHVFEIPLGTGAGKTFAQVFKTFRVTVTFEVLKFSKNSFR